MTGRRRRPEVELAEGVEHGTPEGFAAGCSRDEERCPAYWEHGMSCFFAHLRAESDVRYFRAKVRDPRPAAIAARLGFTRPTPASADETEPQRDVEAEIVAYAKRKEDRDREAAIAKAHPLREPIPSTCPECAAGKHTNCDGTSWCNFTDQPSTCSCTHDPENTPTPEERTMPDKTEPTSTPATKPTPPTGSGRTREELSAIRTWARANGWEVGTSGRIQKVILDAYDNAVAAVDGAGSIDAAAAVALPEGESSTVAEAANDELVHDGPATRDEDGADEDPAESLAEEPLGEYVYADASDALDETRARIDSPVDEVKEDRPDWSHVAVSEDVERARDLAVRLEAENANLITQLDTIGGGLTFALEAWDAAGHRASAAEAALSEAHAAHARAIEHLLRTIAHQRAEVARLSSERERARNDLAAARGTIEQLRARRWWQIGGAR